MEPTITQLNQYETYLNQKNVFDKLDIYLPKFKAEVLDPESDYYKYDDFEEFEDLRGTIENIDVSTLNKIGADLGYESNDEGGSYTTVESATLYFSDKKVMYLDDYDTYKMLLELIDGEAFGDGSITRGSVKKPFNLQIVEEA